MHSQLVEAMKTNLWSPWFRIIASRWLLPPAGWWSDLSRTMTTDDLCDHDNINRFDPPPEHAGGAGAAARLYLEKVSLSTTRSPASEL